MFFKENSEEDQLLDNFDADEYTRTRTNGGLLFVTVPVYKTLLAVEAVVSQHLKSPNHIHVMDSS